MKRQAVWVFAMLVMCPLAARADHYSVVPGPGTGVVFLSHAPMEKFDGKTDQVSGGLTCDLASLAGPVTLAVRVDLASFSTGLSKRDRHLREDYFETEQYPVAVFRGGMVQESSAPAVAVGDTVTLLLAGVLDLHGVQRKLTCAVEVVRPAVDRLWVRARFPVALPDHDIERPQFLLLKVAEKQDVTVHLVLQKDE